MDTFPGLDFRPHSLHDFGFAHDDPANNSDPSGQMIVGLFVDMMMSSIIENGLKNARLTSGAGQAYRGLAALRRVHFGTYRTLKNLQKQGLGIWKGSRNSGEEIHHLVEKRFLNRNYVLTKDLRDKLSRPDDIVSVSLKNSEHRIFTARWQQELGKIGTGSYKRNLDIDDILEAAKKVYRDSPELYHALTKQFL